MKHYLYFLPFVFFALSCTNEEITVGNVPVIIVDKKIDTAYVNTYYQNRRMEVIDETGCHEPVVTGSVHTAVAGTYYVDYDYTSATGKRAATVTMTVHVIAGNVNDTIIDGCLGSYELNSCGNGEMINKTYGRNKIKDGHWITFGMVIQKEKQAGKTNATMRSKIVRAKLEEGYYKCNRKEGYWKYYTEEGKLKDSVKYKKDVLVIK